MNAFRTAGLAIVVVALLIVLAQFHPPHVAAFDHEWSLSSSYNVLSGEHGLWDDTPAGTSFAFRKAEAGLLWLINNDPDDESVVYKTAGVNLSMSAYPILRVRAALSDASGFRIGIETDAGAGLCEFIPGVEWPAAEADGRYRTHAWSIFGATTGTELKSICVRLSDEPDKLQTGRSSVLIDTISVSSRAGTLGWRESFMGPP